MTQNTLDLDALLRPKSIAVVGASKNPDSPGHDYVQCLLDFGFKGEVYPVHRRETEILGLKAYPDLSSIPGDVEFVISCIPSEAILDVIDDAAADPAQHAAAKAELDRLLDQEVEGTAGRILKDAGAYLSTVVGRMKSDVALYRTMLPEYKRNPALLVARLLEQTRQKILICCVSSIRRKWSRKPKAWRLVRREPDMARRLISAPFTSASMCWRYGEPDGTAYGK